MNAFYETQILTARSACDSGCHFTGQVAKRTAKTVTIITTDGIKRCKIHHGSDGEYVYPFGKYSMAPVFRA